ncbi:hypothetical protein ACLOJK_027338, partial [Asimina triloba]
SKYTAGAPISVLHLLQRATMEPATGDRQIGRSDPSKRTAAMSLSPLAVQQPNSTMKIWAAWHLHPSSSMVTIFFRPNVAAKQMNPTNS